MRKLIGCAVLCACASQGAPPGGPPDKEAPKVLSITPDTGKTGVKGGSTVFRFDEVVGERPAGVTTLGDLFIISPRKGAPEISWHRSEIRVRPPGGWLPNTTYTVTMLPGLSDLRGNVRNTGASTYFSTGSALARGVISGSVLELLSGAPARGARVDARVTGDTTISWVTTADSTGAFVLPHLPSQRFLVRAYADKNKNLGVDPDEAWDSATVALTDSASVQLLIVVRDTLPPRISRAQSSDSVTLTVTFDRPADSASALTAANYVVVAADSSVVPILSVKRPRNAAANTPTLSRPMPAISVEMTLGRPLVVKKPYSVRATGVRGILGQTLPSEATFTFTAPIPPAPLPGGAVPIPPPKKK